MTNKPMTDEQLNSIISRSLVRQLNRHLVAERVLGRRRLMSSKYSSLAEHFVAGKRGRPAKCKCDVTAAKVDAAIAKLDAETYKDPLARLDAGETML